MTDPETPASRPAETPAAPSPGLAGWLTARLATRKGRLALYFAMYLLFLGAYAGASGTRLRQHSQYNHFVYLAQTWLSGSLSLTQSPPNENDWVKIDVITLHDGTELRGMWSQRGPSDRFVPLSGFSRTIASDQIASRTFLRYVSFPPLPAAMLLPFVAIWKLKTNDVLFTVLWAAVNPVLLFGLLGLLRARAYSSRTVIEDLLLTLMFGVGSVYFYSSVVGQVWYTAHVVATTMVIGYAWASLEARHPIWAGLFLGLGFATRTPLGFMFPLFVVEALRMHGGLPALWRARRLPPGLVPSLIKFALPAAAVLVVLLAHNEARFERLTEFGHKYLNIIWQDRIQRWGLFNYHFLARNLTVALCLLPRILAHAPYVQVGRHGLSLFVTSPTLALVPGGRRDHPLAPGLWLTVLATALPSLLYQNSGFVQFGYRFSLDYMIFLMMILAGNGRVLGRGFKLLLVLSIAVNLFGAVTFDRMERFTFADSFFPHGDN